MTRSPQPLRLPSLWGVVWNDVPANIVAWMLFVVVATPVAMFGYSLFSDWEPKESWSEAFAAVLVMALACVLFLRYRAARVRRALEEDPAVTARVLRVTPVGQAVTVRLKYDYEGRAIESKFTVPYTRRSAGLKHRTAVTLAVHPKDSRRGIILDLYRSEEDH